MMAKEDIEKPKGKKGKGGMVLIIGIPKPKKGQIKKARRLGGAGFDAGRKRGLHDILRGKNGKRTFMGILSKRRIDPKRFNDMLRQKHNVSIDDLADMEHPPAGLNLQNLLNEQAETGARGRRVRSQKRGLLNPSLFQGKGAFSRYTPDMVEAVIDSPDFKGGDDAIQEVKDRLKGQEQGRTKESYRDRQDRLSAQRRAQEEDAEVRGEENYEDPDDAYRRRFRERGIGEDTKEEMEERERERKKRDEEEGVDADDEMVQRLTRLLMARMPEEQAAQEARRLASADSQGSFRAEGRNPYPLRTVGGSIRSQPSTEFAQPFGNPFASMKDDDDDPNMRIFTSFDKPNPLEAAISLLKQKDDEDVEDAFMDQCYQCGAMVPSGQMRNHRCR